MRIRIRELEKLQAEWKAFAERDGDFGLAITVVYTSHEGTLAALRAAGALAKDLDARLDLIVPEVVPFRLPLDQPRVSPEFLEQRQAFLIAESGLESERIRVQICVCRDTKETLGRLLSTESLVLIGGRKGWWPTRERRLETFLSRLGHQVVFIDFAAQGFAEEPGGSGGRQSSPETSAP